MRLTYLVVSDDDGNFYNNEINQPYRLITCSFRHAEAFCDDKQGQEKAFRMAVRAGGKVLRVKCEFEDV